MPKAATAPAMIKSKKSKQSMRKSRPKKKKVILGKDGKAPAGISMRQPHYVPTKRQEIGIM